MQSEAVHALNSLNQKVSVTSAKRLARSTKTALTAEFAKTATPESCLFYYKILGLH